MDAGISAPLGTASQLSWNLLKSIKTSKFTIRTDPPYAESFDVYFVTFHYEIGDPNVTKSVSAGVASNAKTHKTFS